MRSHSPRSAPAAPGPSLRSVSRRSVARMGIVLGALLGVLSVGCSPSREGDDVPGGQKKPGSGTITPPPPDHMPLQCTKVDVLFVIDDSGSMADNQLSLIRSFPGFVAGMQRKLAGAIDYHVGIVTSDDYYGNDPRCTKIGSLVTRTGGPKSSQKDCGPFASGARYLRSTDPDLGQRFACAAQVGAGGSDDEKLARSLLNAVTPAVNAPGACNAGFLRPDSLLVVVMITDEDDIPDECDGMTCRTYGSGGTPDSWFTEFKKSRDPGRTVVLSLLGRRGDNSCGAVAAANLMRFTNKFAPNAFLGDICATSYDAFFEAALPVIENACTQIPG